MRRLRNLSRSAGWPIALLTVIAVSAAGATAAQKLTGRDVANSSLTGVDVRNSSLSGVDIRNRSLTPRDFRESVRGPQGPQGPQGPPGNIAQRLKFARSDPLVLAPGDVDTAFAVCPANTVAISGGHDSFPLDLGVPAVLTIVTKSYPDYNQVTDRFFWAAEVVNADGVNTAIFFAEAVCAPTGANAAAALRDRGPNHLSERLRRVLSRRDRGGVSGRLQPEQLP